MDRDVTGRLRNMVGALFSRNASSSSRSGGGGGGIRAEAVDIIRAPPTIRAKEAATDCLGSFRAGVWVSDSAQEKPSSPQHRSKSPEKEVNHKEHNNFQSVERSTQHNQVKPQASHADSDAVTSVSSNDTRSASLTMKVKPTSHSRVHADVRDRYSTLPAFSSKAHPTHQHTAMTRSVYTEKPSTTEPLPPRNPKKLKEEEVKRLARSMANSIENLIGNLHGIVGDLRQLVLQIDAVTESIDTNCGPDSMHQQRYNKAARRCNEAAAAAAASSNTYTQTDFEQTYATWDHKDGIMNRERLQIRAFQRYSYPQHFYGPTPVLPQKHASDADKQMHRRPRSSRGPTRGRADRVKGKASDPERGVTVGNRDVALNTASELGQSNPIPIRRRPQVPACFNGSPLEEAMDHAAVSFVSNLSPDPSITFVPAESPPNPAPTLFGSYRQEKSDRVKDTDSLPDPELKNWREMMERQCGSADSLTPQMDWSYLALTDHQNPSLTVQGFRFSKSNRQLECVSPKPSYRIAPAGHQSALQHTQGKDWPKLSPPGMKMKHKVSAIPRIPEQGELCDSGYGRDDFPQGGSQHNVGIEPAKTNSCGVAPNAKQDMNGTCEVFCTDSDPKTACCVGPQTSCCVGPQEQTGTGVFPQVQRSIGGASLGWSTSNKALPGWPSEDLSSIGASDSEIDDLSSPYLHQHFHYPRRSSAREPSPEKDPKQVDPKMSRASSASETIASGGFEVRNDVEISPESDVAGSYRGQYESAMENRLEQLSNEVEGSDFSDADADVGSDVLEQSLTSLEDTSSAKYDRELNTWTSYTMTHIDSDDVVSDCTSEILNENFCDATATNPGFDDVSLNFDDVGFPAFPLTQSRLDSLNTNL